MDMRRLLPVFLLCALMPVYGTIYQEGIASWYGGEFHGQLTANGEIFDTYQISAAHQELPFGTVVRVTNLENGLTVDVRINDRGPFFKDRIIDLSYAAAEQIDMIRPGTAPVTLELLYTPKIPEDLYHRVPDVDSYRIQIAAFSAPERAERVRQTLAEQELHGVVREGEDSLHRVFLEGVAKQDLEQTVSLLENLGFSFVLIRGEQ